MRKRGQIIYQYLILLIISAIIFISFQEGARSYGTGEVHFKAGVAKDLALTINEMYASSEDITYYYPQDLTRHTISISGNTISVYSSSYGPMDVSKATSYYIGPAISATSIKNPKSLLLIKKSNTITLSSG